MITQVEKMKMMLQSKANNKKPDFKSGFLLIDMDQSNDILNYQGLSSGYC